MSTDTPTRSPMSLSDQTRLKLPLPLWLAVMASAALAGGMWFALQADVHRHTVQIGELQQETRRTTELLIRIDANVSAMKEAQTRRQGN